MKKQIINLDETKVSLKIVLVSLAIVISIFTIIGISYYISDNMYMFNRLVKYVILMLSISVSVVLIFLGIRKLINKLF